MNAFNYENYEDSFSVRLQIPEESYSSCSVKSSKNSTRPKRRLILKNGDCNLEYSKLSRRSRITITQDFFTYLVKSSWHVTLIAFSIIIFLGWTVFAIIWWLIAYSHGDFEPQHLPPYQNDSDFTPCVRQLYDFKSCFLFSMESQHTVGYGLRAPTEECPEAMFVNTMQCIFGMIIEACITGTIFAKMTLSKKRTETLLFSRNALICMRDGVLCFMFRVGDVRKYHIIDAEIKAILVRTERTTEGEVLRQTQTKLQIFADDCEMHMHFIWPMIMVHKIDQNSPLYDLSPSNLQFNSFEIVVILEGTIESTGQSTQARSSYLPSEILWGHRFEQILEFDSYFNEYVVDFSKFHSTIPVYTPLCSARTLKQQEECVSNSSGLETEKPTRKISVKHTVCLGSMLELFSFENVVPVVALDNNNDNLNVSLNRKCILSNNLCEENNEIVINNI